MKKKKHIHKKLGDFPIHQNLSRFDLSDLYGLFMGWLYIQAECGMKNQITLESKRVMLPIKIWTEELSKNLLTKLVRKGVLF